MSNMIWTERTRGHMMAHPGMEHLAEEAFAKAEAFGVLAAFTPITIGFGKTIGKSQCVPVMAQKFIQVQKRPGRDSWSRVCTFKDPMPTDCVTILLGHDKKTLITAYCGEGAPREPWDKSMNPQEKSEAEIFWNTHALSVDSMNGVHSMSFKDYCEGKDPPDYRR